MIGENEACLDVLNRNQAQNMASDKAEIVNLKLGMVRKVRALRDSLSNGCGAKKVPMAVCLEILKEVDDFIAKCPNDPDAVFYKAILEDTRSNVMFWERILGD